jgi:hypothetical protein
MGVEIKLTDKELPVSPVFIDFLVHIVDETPFEEAIWGDQLSEELANENRRLMENVEQNAQRVVETPFGQQQIARAYELLVALLTGDMETIKDIQLRFHFINVIGVPRNGGSYLTKEIYRSLGHDPQRVPNVIAHDGFPEAGPFRFERSVNSWISSLQTMAEFITLVEIYFGKERPRSGKIIVPKKLTKGTYAGGFFHRILGAAVENILTVRHPVTSCISTYEKSGGFPEDGRFAVRGNIEDWVRRDLVYTGCEREDVMAMNYFDAYLRYWEQYHYYIATTGLSANKDIRVVAYGRERMMDVARGFYYRFGDRDPKPESFQVFDKRDRHPEWLEPANAAVERVAGVWKTVGLEFPLDEVIEAW